MLWRGSLALCVAGALFTGVPAAAAAGPDPVRTQGVAPRMSAMFTMGAKGPHIVALQQALINRGFSIPAGPTGFFGPQTRAAVAAFQVSQGWSRGGADGIPGPQTLARLGVSGGPQGGPAIAPAPSSVPAAFLAQHGAAIRTAASNAGVPPLVAMAQAGLESGWGTRASGNNFFGVKARPGDPGSMRQLRQTIEVLPVPDAAFPEVLSVTPLPDGRYQYVVRDWFRTYATPADSFRDHAALLGGPRYRGAMAVRHDPYAFAAAVHAAGYATDPGYTAKLHAVMRLIESLGYG